MCLSAMVASSSTKVRKKYKKNIYITPNDDELRGVDSGV